MENKIYFCDTQKKCNACQLLNLSYKEQLLHKEKTVTKLFGTYCTVENIIGMDCPVHYRNKAQAVFKSDKNKIIWGIYKSTTKTLAQTNGCMLHTNKANMIFISLCKLFKSFKIQPYDAYKKTGYLKSVTIRQGFNSGEIMVVLTGNSKIFPAKKTFATALKNAHPEITTAVICTNNSDDKLFVGEMCDILFGDGFITDRLCSLDFIISPDSFYQINSLQTKRLYETAMQFAQLSKNDTVLDAYCGVGTIGLIASKECKNVISVEKNASAVGDAIKNAKLNKINNIHFYCDDAKAFIKKASDENKFNVIFIDPPRAGCDKEFIDTVCACKPERIVYISCNVQTQIRDVRRFLKLGYKIKKCRPVDMFPHTNHVETVVLLSRNQEE